MPLVDATTLKHLDEHGYCVVRSVIDPGTAAVVRGMMDTFLGPPAAHCDCEALGLQKGTMWPVAGSSKPLLTEEGAYMHSLQHPIPDARTALPVPPLMKVMGEVLRCSVPADELVLIHQNFRRTDPSPPDEGPYGHPKVAADGTFDGTSAGFHQDSGFLPEHYAAMPRQNYYIAILAFSKVVSGGAAFVYSPGSMAVARRAADKIPLDVRAGISAAGCRGVIPGLIAKGVDGPALRACREVAKEVIALGLSRNAALEIESQNMLANLV
jgi:hypothetical protein